MTSSPTSPNKRPSAKSKKGQRLNIAGPNIQRIRLANGITQEQLAAKLQILEWAIDRQGVSKIERGEREITDKELVTLAEALGVNVGRLLEGQEKR